MREDSRRGTSGAARAPGRPGVGRDTRAPRTGGRAGGQGSARPYDGGRPPQGSRPAPQGEAGTAKLTSAIEPVLAAMEIDLEAVKLSSAGRRAVLRIVVDADGGLSLDDIADASREISAKLDAKNVMGDAPYTLEVTSPGVDRPLTQPRHWRRATGRLVLVAPLSGKDQDSERAAATTPVEYLGRVVDADQEHVGLEIDGERRVFSFDELGPGRVQVEFGRLDEIDDVDGADDLDGTDAAQDSWQGADTADGSGPDEEEPDGH
jgi:ribosome maturation factor RimP